MAGCEQVGWCRCGPRWMGSCLEGVVEDLVGAIGRFRGQGRRLRRFAEASADRMAGLQGLSEAELRLGLQTHREAFRRDMIGGQGALLAALAAVGEVAGRQLGLRPYPVQLMGALALHQGWLAEMATGEGKTLTVAMAAVLAGWSGRPCHLVTANDYLAARDALEMGPLYRYCGVSVVAVTGDLLPHERAERYSSDVVYVTAKELLADFLRDRQAANAGGDPARAMLPRWLWREAPGGGYNVDLLLVRALHSALIDDADSFHSYGSVSPLHRSSPRPDSYFHHYRYL